MTFEEWFRKQYGSHQKGFGLCEADLEGAWKAALQHAAELALKADAKIERLRTALGSAQGGFLLAYDAASKHLHDEVLLHCGHHEAQIANVLETPNVELSGGTPSARMPG